MNLRNFLLEKLSEKDVEKLSDKIDDLEEKTEKAEEKAEDAEKAADDAEKEASKSEESIKDEKDFRAAAKAKFEEVFGADLDEKKMKEVVDGILSKYKEDADNGNWGKLIGVLNKSFGK